MVCMLLLMVIVLKPNRPPSSPYSMCPTNMVAGELDSVGVQLICTQYPVEVKLSTTNYGVFGKGETLMLCLVLKSLRGKKMEMKNIALTVVIVKKYKKKYSCKQYGEGIQASKLDKFFFLI